MLATTRGYKIGHHGDGSGKQVGGSYIRRVGGATFLFFGAALATAKR